MIFGFLWYILCYKTLVTFFFIRYHMNNLVDAMHVMSQSAEVTMVTTPD